MLDIPLTFFSNVNGTSGRNVLLGNNHIVRTLTNIGTITLSGANAVASNRFGMRGMRAMNSRIDGGRLLSVTSTVRTISARPVTADVISRTGRRNVAMRTSSFIRRLTNRNVINVIGKRRMLINGHHLVRHCTIRNCPARTARCNARMLMTRNGMCLNHVVVTSRTHPSSTTTVTSLGNRSVGAIVLANSTRTDTGCVTGRANMDTIHTRLLPRSGLSIMRSVHSRCNPAVFMNSNVGSTPILTNTSINNTVKDNTSTTVRTTSIMFVHPSLATVTRVLSLSGTALHIT